MDIQDGNAKFAVRSMVKSVNGQHADGNGNITIDNVNKWDGYTNDLNTENNTDTWIPVLKDKKMQHTTLARITAAAASSTVSKNGNALNFANGLQIRYGGNCSMGWVNFSTPFSNDCTCVIASIQTLTNNGRTLNVTARDWSKTGFQLRSVGLWDTQANGASEGTDSIKGSYVAFGW